MTDVLMPAESNVDGVHKSPQNLCPVRATSEAVIHPLVILNISEHFTRVKTLPQNKGKDLSQIRVCGALLGKLSGRHLELVNTFAIKMSSGDVDGNQVIDGEFFIQRQEQYKEVFPEMELVGWYTTGLLEPEVYDMELHKMICSFTEWPILLKLNPVPDLSKANQQLPLALLDNSGAEASSSSTFGFKFLDWTLGSEESERIGIDHVAKLSTFAGNMRESEEGKHIRSYTSASNMLIKRIETIRNYLEAVIAGSVAFDNEIIREANKLVLRLPMLQPDQFQAYFSTVQNDVNAAVLLANMAETCGGMGQLLSKVNQMQSEWMTMAHHMAPAQSRIMHHMAAGPGSGTAGPSKDMFMQV